MIKKLYYILPLFLSMPALYAESHGVSEHAYVLTKIGGVPITNALATSWTVSLFMILIARWIAGKAELVPTRRQAVLETLIGGIRDIIEPIVGKRMLEPVFPLLVTLFIFIIVQNWSGLLPGVGTFGHYDSDGHFLYYVRPANSDLNMTFALSIVSFIAWLFFIFKYAGAKQIAFELFGNKANKKEVPIVLYYFLTLIFFLVSFIEIISIMFRPVSLSFRLYGNIFGGENLLTSMHGLFKYLLPVPFYFLEVVIGAIQAFVFMLLTAVYIGLMCNHEGSEEEGHAH